MTKPFLLYGLTGLPAAGKDTAADILVSHCGFVKVAFADALYAEVAEAFGVTIASLKHRDLKETPTPALALDRCNSDAFTGRIIVLHQKSGNPVDPGAPRSPRTILRWWANEYRRCQSERYWVSKVSARIAYDMKARLHTRFVIPDCRFHNQIEMVRQGFGGQIWQITRPGVVWDGHEAETTGDVFKPEHTIDNSGDIAHLQVLTIGAWLMHDTGINAGDLVRMGIAHVAQAGQEWHQATPTHTGATS